jgi:gliding motility-associated lipoprotein GldD
MCAKPFTFTGMIKRCFIFLIPVLMGVLILSSCGDEEDEVYSPKPRGYFRIDMPKKEYVRYDSTCPFSFEYPRYAAVINDKHKGAEPCWLNIEFPRFKATIHLSYKAVNNNISTFLEDARNFAVKHQIKATGMNETVIIRDSSKVYGLLYDIEGNTASSLQFYVTDSTRHFLRGALYFNASPNIDSLKIVLDFIRQDVLNMIKTTKWK